MLIFLSMYFPYKISLYNMICLYNMVHSYSPKYSFIKGLHCIYRSIYRSFPGWSVLNLSLYFRCLSASPRSLSQEELDMLVSSFNMFTEACRDNGELRA